MFANPDDRAVAMNSERRATNSQASGLKRMPVAFMESLACPGKVGLNDGLKNAWRWCPGSVSMNVNFADQQRIPPYIEGHNHMA